jgi:peroxiredoxin
MAQLRRDYQQFVSRDAAVIAVGPESAGAFSRFWLAEKMPFTGIPDPRHTIAKLFRQEVSLLKLGRMPALFVIDKMGKVRYRHYGTSMSDIPEDTEILSLLDDLNKERNDG